MEKLAWYALGIVGAWTMVWLALAAVGQNYAWVLREGRMWPFRANKPGMVESRLASVPDQTIIYRDEVAPFVGYLHSVRREICTTKLSHFRAGTPDHVRCICVPFETSQERTFFLEKLAAELGTRAGGAAVLEEIKPIVSHEINGLYMLAFLGALVRPSPSPRPD